MSESNGPKVDIPDELAAELEDQSAATEESHADASDVEKQLAELNDKYLRLAAEFDNYKRRTLKEHQDLFNYANENLIKELLATVDNLERALVHVRQQDEEEASEGENLGEGVELTYRSLFQALEKTGVQVVDPEGEKFDPKVHEALRQDPSAEHEPGTIIEVYQKGYLLKDRLLRPALVAVSGPASDVEADSE
jgi:molecular chaperone GrpE